MQVPVMPTPRALPIAFAAATLVAALGTPAGSAMQKDPSRFASVKQWSAEVTLLSDCDRFAFDGSRTVIHNRTVTTYDFAQRVTGASGLRWRGRATTTYKWSVGMGVRESLDLEEGTGSYETDGELELGDTITISIGKVPSRPFTRKKLVADTVVVATTADDETPAADLAGAPLPSDDETARGSRAEAGYVLLGGVVLTCPGQRQWTVHSGAPAKP